MPDIQSQPIAWGKHELSDGQTLRFTFGEQSIQMRRDGDEFLLASPAQESDMTDPDTDSPEWARWVLKESMAPALRIAPKLPDLPVVVQPEVSFSLTPGAQALIYVTVPLWIAVETNPKRKKDAEVLAEFPAQTLSQTWFGEVENGELCYWISSSARREVPLEHENLGESESIHCLAPLRIVNGSDEVLKIERICLHLNQLDVYQGENHLWTNQSKVRYRGGRESSLISVTSGAPPEAGTSSKKIGNRREEAESGFVAKTFRSLQMLTFWTDEG